VAVCRQLTPEGRCSVHGTPAQPIVCTTYNEHTCWYRRELPNDLQGQFVRIDHARMAALVEHMTFDDRGVLVETPPWAALPELFAPLEMVLDDRAAGNGAGAAALTGPLQPTPPAPSSGPQRRSALAMLNSDPCQDCAAYCCTALLFPLTTPANLSNLDYLRFALGFPGVEAVVTNDAWMLAVRTRCRHLDGTRCAVYGQPERPSVCTHYDARTCGYRPMFGPGEAAASLRISFEQLDSLLAAVQVEPDGTIVEMPSLDDLRQIVRIRCVPA
jgi:hypothetical protein